MQRLILHFEEYIKDVSLIKDLSFHHSISCLVLLSREIAEQCIHYPPPIAIYIIICYQCPPKNLLCSVGPSTQPLPASYLYAHVSNTIPFTRISRHKNSSIHHFGGGEDDWLALTVGCHHVSQSRSDRIPSVINGWNSRANDCVG